MPVTLVPALGSTLAISRSIFAYIVIALYLLVIGPPAILIAARRRSAMPLFRAATPALRLIFPLTGVRYDVIGREHLARGRGAVYCFNHTSNIDGPIVFRVLEPIYPRLRAVYKAELGRVPILGLALETAGFVPVERGHKEQTARALEEATAKLRAGDSFVVAPEGTRSPTGELLPFKKGPFIMAIGAQAPIVPMALVGARAAMPKGRAIVRPARVIVRLGEPIETAGLTVEDVEELSAEVRRRLESMLRT